jgi:hypothetical protein
MHQVRDLKGQKRDMVLTYSVPSVMEDRIRPFTVNDGQNKKSL